MGAALDPFSNAISTAAETVGPSVVQIVAHSPASGHPAGTGSGVVWDATGHLVTNAHVVGGSRHVDVNFADGRRQVGEVVGADVAFDLAVVRVARVEELRPAAFADSDLLRPGAVVIAVGNPYGLRWSVTLGVISAVERILPGPAGEVLDGMLQTDAAINPGNSGGPLALLDGGIVGITTAMLEGTQGLGFAIPANTVVAVGEQLRDRGRASHPWLGIEGQPETVPDRWVRLFALETDSGVVVTGVYEGSPADRAGLRTFDLIVSIDGRPTKTPSAVRRALALIAPGRPVRVRFLRGGEPGEVDVWVAERPPASRH
jgi:S1-C subfamily serine protease